MGKNYDYSYEWGIRYCYPNSFTLRNKFNITNNEELSIAEMEYTSLSIAEIKDSPIKGDFNLKHLQDIHRHIFRDIYDWAGELRTVNISKGNPFCNCIYIDIEAERIFLELRKENYLIGIPKSNICHKLAYYLGEINVLHPFREGNGRTQRVMIEYLAKVAGYKVDFSNIFEIEMIEASVDTFNCNYAKMAEIFRKITKPITKEEQEDFIKEIATKNSSVIKAYNIVKENKPLS